MRAVSGNLGIPGETMTVRRLSDSVLRGQQDSMAPEAESDELAKLRKWAAEAMAVRPQRSETPKEDDSGSSPRQRRESDGRLRHQPADFHYNTMPRHLGYDRSSSPEPHLPGNRWSLLDGFQARPVSMFAMPSPTHANAPSLEPSPSQSPLIASPSRVSSRASRAAGTAVVEDHELAIASSTLTSSPRHQTAKFLLATKGYSPTCPPLPGSSSAALRRPQLSSHSFTLPKDQTTPRPRTVAGLASPTWTSSTCESEDDGAGLMTPLDENGPRQPSASTAHRSYTGDTPPLGTLGDGVADRVGVSRGLDTLGSSADATMQSMTGVDLAGRRGSIPSVKLSDGSFKLFSAPTVSTMDSLAMEATASTVPALNRSTLFDVGFVDGITPPALREQHSAGSRAFSSVVSAGLEMGLGVSMASSALSNNLPTASSSGINSITEPRFARPLGFESFAMGLKMTNSEMPLNSVPAPAHYPPEAVSDRAADEVTFAELDREDAELARRRTTGNIPAKREAIAAGKRRHARADTHDPASGKIGSTNSSTIPASSKGHIRLNSSVSTFPDLAEEEPVLQGSLGNGLTRLRISKDSSSSAGTSSLSDAIASGGHGSTPMGTPLQSHKAMLSPDIAAHLDRSSYLSSRNGEGHDGDKGNTDKQDGAARGYAGGAGVVNGGLMGMGGGGHFGPGVRAKIGEVLGDLIAGVELSGQGDETVQLVEYGCLNSRSAQLMQPIISAFATRSQSVKVPQEAGYFARPNGAFSTASSRLSFQITHEDSSAADFRPLTQLLETHSVSYLDPHWQNMHSPSLANAVFSNFVARPFASRIAPPQTFHAGFSLMDLHWTHTPSNPNISPATTAQAELLTFLSARGQEFKRGGVLIMAYISRSDDAAPVAHKDIWTTLSNTLAPCIQRLVSCSMVKSDVARHLLNLPIHPRSAKQTRAVLKSVRQTWDVEWSCGLGEEEKEGEGEGLEPVGPSPSSKLRSEPQPLRLPHPAWKAYSSGTLSRVPFTEHMIQLFKNLYESHFRSVLREKGKLSKGAVEFVLDSLWDVLFSRIVDRHPSPMKDVEIEVNIVALRRR